MFGIYYSLAHLSSLYKDLPVQNTTFHIHYDGLSAIQSIQNINLTHFCTKKHFDILNSIKVLILKLPFQYELHHVKGHQDQGTAYVSLSRLAQLNLLVDDKAKQKARDIAFAGTPHQQTSIALSPIDIYIKAKEGHSTKICTDMIDSLRKIITTDISRQYWIKKKNLNLHPLRLHGIYAHTVYVTLPLTNTAGYVNIQPVFVGLEVCY